MKMTNRIMAALLCTILVMSMAGCATGNNSSATGSTAAPESTPATPATPAPTATPDMVLDDRHYSIYLDNGDTLTFDADGKIVPDEEQFGTINDLLTGEPMLLTRSRTDVDEERDVDGYPITHEMSALHDLDGKLLHDWSEYSYRGGFGDYVIRMDSSLYGNMGWNDPELDEYVALWNYKTGQDVVQNASRMEKLDDDSVLLSAVDGTFMGVMDINSGGPVFRPAPEGYSSPNAWYGNILAEAAQGKVSGGKNRTYTLMDRNYKPIFTAQRVNGRYVGLRGKYILADNSSGTRVIVDAKGDTIFAPPTAEENIDYFDGELVLVSKENIAESGKETTYEVPQPDGEVITYHILGGRKFIERMLKTDGTELAGGYDSLRPDDDNSADNKQPAKYFIGIRGSTVDILDRTGKVTDTVNIPALDHIGRLGESHYTYTMLSEDQEPDENGWLDPGFVGLMDKDLNIVMHADRYTYIDRRSSRESGAWVNLDVLQCEKTASGGVQRYDILDMNGKVLIENLTQVGDVGPNRIAAVKGFNVGVMDWQGNWIAKQPIFDSMEDEKGWIY